MSTVSAELPRLRASAARVAPAAALAVLALAAVYGFLAIRTWPGTDSMYALLWARDILHGVRPAFDGYRTPTEHPLLIVVGMLLSPLGDTAPRAFVFLCVAGLVALTAAVWRLGRIVAGFPGAVVAATLVLTRLDFPFIAAIGFLDVPYCALIGWAVVLEAERPRRGGPVWLLLVLGGLLRPEAWLLTGLYAAWILRKDGAQRLREAVGFTAIAPTVWLLSDLLVTGDALFSLHHVHAMAAELGRERPAVRLPWIMVKLLTEILKVPVLVGGVIGAGAALRLGPRLHRSPDTRQARTLAICGALVTVTCTSYLLIASGGPAIVYRYLLTAALGLIVLCAFAVGGWSTIAPGRLRTRWTAAALSLGAVAAAWTAAHVHPGLIRTMLDQRTASHDNLVALLHDPAVAEARRCGPLSVPNHKLIADIRWTLRLPDGAVVPRSLATTRQATNGVAIVIDRRVERRPELDVREVPTDRPGIQVPPPGFRPIAHNRSFVAWAHCPGWAPWRPPQSG